MQCLCEHGKKVSTKEHDRALHHGLGCIIVFIGHLERAAFGVCISIMVFDCDLL